MPILRRYSIGVDHSTVSVADIADMPDLAFWTIQSLMLPSPDQCAALIAAAA